MKILITCVPMILRIEQYKEQLSSYDIIIPEFTQIMSEERLINIINEYDGWIVGDDPVTKKVLEKAVNLKVLVKWGVGIDNIDLKAVEEFKIPFSNTPGMFGNEVADVAIGYLICLTRKLNEINNQVRKGNWYKPSGISLENKKVALIGFGDIGRNIADRLISLKTQICVYDPGFIKENGNIKCLYSDLSLDERFNVVNIEKDIFNVFKDAKIVILACSSNKDNYHLINNEIIKLLDDKCYIINVSRGSLVKEDDIIQNLINGKITGFASDVFENEPIINSHSFINMTNVILGSHNASNTEEAVDKTSIKCINIIKNHL